MFLKSSKQVRIKRTQKTLFGTCNEIKKRLNVKHTTERQNELFTNGHNQQIYLRYFSIYLLNFIIAHLLHFTRCIYNNLFTFIYSSETIMIAGPIAQCVGIIKKYGKINLDMFN